jgi:protoheme IX farnesyltransferase
MLLVAGASVTSNRAGLAVPDWPTTYGQFMFTFPYSKWAGNIFYEHGHRLIASAVGLLAIVLAAWLLRAEPRPWVKRLGLAALAAVIAQGLLGGLTVKLFLPPAISIAHAALAQAFFCMTIWLAMATSAHWAQDTAPVARPVRSLSLITTAVIYVQLILGAAIRHANRAIAPHIIVAAIMLLLATGIFMVARQRRLATGLLAAVVAQIALGIVTLLIRLPKNAGEQLSTAQILLPTAHLALGALVLGLSFALTVKLRLSPIIPASFCLRRAGARIELVKPRIVAMVLAATALGFYLGSAGDIAWPAFALTLVGVGCAAAGAAALNNYLERDSDAKMTRTRRRALPAGLVSPSNALAAGICLVLAGSLVLAWRVNLLTGFLALLAAFLYVLVYTPMKRTTWLCTTVGAIPGAIPPLCGWAAATGRLDAGAWTLFAILFLWQHPHFYSIAWMFRDDYRRAGLKMLPAIDTTGTLTLRLTLVFCAVLLVTSLAPVPIHMAGRVYLAGALTAGLALLAVGAMFARSQSLAGARRLLRASLIYLPVLFSLAVADSGCSQAQPLPVLAEVPDFELTEASGKTIQRADLEGKVWLAAFIFTRCSGTCPVMSGNMSDLQSKLPAEGNLRFVSFTVDPDWDRPAVLEEYARRYQADRSRWLFVTGQKPQVRQLARLGFRLTAEDATTDDTEPILHSSYFVLVDRQARIRGYYDGTDEVAVARLVRDARSLLKDARL